jgi:MFS family permease
LTYRRGWIALLIFTIVIINYIDRIALSVAAKPIVAEFGFSPIQMGYLFSGFLWTYVVCLVPLGLLVERTGAKTWLAGALQSGRRRRLSRRPVADSSRSFLQGSPWAPVRRRPIRPAAA